jgi:hypothetical protein
MSVEQLVEQMIAKMQLIFELHKSMWGKNAQVQVQ